MSTGKKDIVEYAYSLIRTLPRVQIHSLRRPINRKITGMKKGNRGKGHNARRTYFAVGSENKKTPFVIQMPSEPYYRDYLQRREYPPISLQKLQLMIDTGRIDPTKPIDLSSFLNTGLYTVSLRRKEYGVNLTDTGADSFVAKVNIEVQWASESTIAAIERNGGVITTAYYDVRSLVIMKEPKPFFESGQCIPRRLPPPDNAVMYYTSPENRGYLADPEQVSLQRLILAQKYGYKLPKIEEDPAYDMLMKRKDPRQIFFFLEPGWVVNLRERAILRSLSPVHEQYFKS